MAVISTREAAKRLGIHFTTLAEHIAAGRLAAPMILKIGTKPVHAWTESDVKKARKLLPKIANGRKTRYQKQHSATSSQHSVKSKPKAKTKKKPQVRAPVPHKQRRKKK